MLVPILVAVVVSALLAAAWLWRRTGGLALFAVAWLAYAGYEYLMYARIACSGECNIRVDLLLLYPFLLIGTLIVLGRAIFRRKQATGN